MQAFSNFPAGCLWYDHLAAAAMHSDSRHRRCKRATVFVFGCSIGLGGSSGTCYRRRGCRQTAVEYHSVPLSCVWGCGVVPQEGSPGRGTHIASTPSCVSQRSLHNAPIFRLLLKVAVNGTHQCDFPNFCGQQCPTKQLKHEQRGGDSVQYAECMAIRLSHGNHVG